MGQVVVQRRAYAKSIALTEREQLVVLEIGRDSIDSASAFVGYISEMYGFSKSSVWYNLNRLKEKGLAEFASREDQGRPLALTRSGMDELEHLEPLRNRLIEAFSQAYLKGQESNGVVAEYGWAVMGGIRGRGISPA